MGDFWVVVGGDLGHKELQVRKVVWKIAIKRVKTFGLESQMKVVKG
jgi:hypothetical protein